ncbi:hypothetical protein Csa_021006 [Cucumis sativus]|uniref:Uncharacterized protein n=1 Tax=Cucumis sativus TaxID=3659 RepID=A0A0A0KBA5_CUCSA|nr:hypothetical protein Csa_021006 [Cucumis sativus]
MPALNFILYHLYVSFIMGLSSIPRNKERISQLVTWGKTSIPTLFPSMAQHEKREERANDRYVRSSDYSVSLMSSLGVRKITENLCLLNSLLFSLQRNQHKGDLKSSNGYLCYPVLLMLSLGVRKWERERLLNYPRSSLLFV